MADQPKQSLALSYAMSRRNPKMRPAKMAAGGEACTYCAAGECPTHGPAKLAEGGIVQNDLSEHTEHARKSLELPATRKPLTTHTTEMPAMDIDEPESIGTIMHKVKGQKPAFATGGLVDEILAERRPQPEMEAEEPVEELGPDTEPLMEEGIDMSNYHSMDDEEHDNIPATEDDSLVGQILKARRASRRGL